MRSKRRFVLKDVNVAYVCDLSRHRCSSASDCDLERHGDRKVFLPVVEDLTQHRRAACD